MADELIAVQSNTARTWNAKRNAYGYGYKVTRFVTGSNGHNPSNPRLPIAPDPERAGCYCGSDAITTADGCLFSDFIDEVVFTTPYCPVYVCVLESGESIGVVSSICLIAEITCSPIPDDPLIGTEFLYATVNMPYRPKIAGETIRYEIYVPTKL